MNQVVVASSTIFYLASSYCTYGIVTFFFMYPRLGFTSSSLECSVFLASTAGSREKEHLHAIVASCYSKINHVFLVYASCA